MPPAFGLGGDGGGLGGRFGGGFGLRDLSGGGAEPLRGSRFLAAAAALAASA